MNLAELTGAMQDRVAKQGAIAGKVVIFDFGGDGLIRLDGKAEPASVSNDDGDADCRVRITLDDFADIADGKQNPQMAFMTGKIKVEGDLGIAMQLGQLLG